MVKKKTKDERTRNWRAVVYPESAPENWREILDDMCIPWVESPLHDRDVNPDGEVKKPHWHIILLFGSNKSYEQVKEITAKLRAPNPMKCANVRGAVRYLAHLDNPEKFQYSKEDIKAHCGAEIDHHLAFNSNEKSIMKREIQALIREKDFVEYADLLDYLLDAEMYELLDVANSHTLLFGKYISSRKYKQQGK
ncbi:MULTISPECIES: replication protein [unclassified Enterococcus]|uniref:replication protein n=1 Tax=unclassified Enterococcus TaxID=2608891 RepID=UPI001F61D7E2|nr:replication protein [Enterococcus sp. DIV1271a]